MIKKHHEKLDSIIYEYQDYLRNTLGASEGTIVYFTIYVKKFLKEKYGVDDIILSNIEVSDIINFVTSFSGTLKPRSIQNIGTSLRSFLKYLHIKGLCKPHLIEAIPKISNWKLSHVPKQLTQKEVTSLLDTFDLTIPLGLRDYAMALCLARLGLRSCEVANLCIHDIDWILGVLKISKTKCRRTEILPLLQDVGEAIVNYLKNGRPKTKSNHVFVRHTGSIGEPIKPREVRASIHSAFTKSGIKIATKGTHALRSTVASQLIQQGATIKEVADVLRHHSFDTTAIYTKINLPMLREVAMPWPEEV